MSRRAGLFVPEEEDQRFATPANADERTLLLDLLAAQRSTLELKCAGLTGELADRSVEPSTLSLLGLVRHLAEVERRWFRLVLAAEALPPLYTSPEAPDHDFDGTAGDPASIAEAWAAWRTEVAFGEAFVAAAPSLDVEGEDDWRGTVSLRWVLLHLIEEYARHNGHADLLRERIDGARGM
ncbi:DinB family protein [Kitasatospora sp. NPDC002227]|uniref:DinB family protein n=1 Tax=Kitasatospora sp. NPDC002227 TaxID=3154773 RepID=UPI00331FC6EA